MRWAILLGFALATLVSREAAAQEKTLSGRWSASAMRVAWRIGQWGDACGPKPGGGGAPAGAVQIIQQGGELQMTGAGPSYSTARCWETMPGMKVSHTGGKRGWRSTCKTTAGDPRQATIVTSISATDDSISFDETGQYQFVIKGQNCTASVRRTRSFTLTQREGEAPPAPKPEPAPPAAPAQTEEPKEAPVHTPVDCREPGEPARLEVRPRKKLLRPGEEFEFRAIVLDARGCPAVAAPDWRMMTPDARIELVAPGKVRVPADAPEGAFELAVAFGTRTVSVSIEIASSDRYEALLGEGAFNASGEIDEAAVVVIASSSVGGSEAVAKDVARSRRTTFLAVLGSVAVALGLTGLVIALRTKRRPRKPVEAAPPATMRSAPGSVFCPTCHAEYPSGSQFCPTDGNRLLAVDPSVGAGPAGGICGVCGQGFDPGVTACPEHGEEIVPAIAYRAAEPLAEKLICPLCGTMYEGGRRFCGTDGGALVPVN